MADHRSGSFRRTLGTVSVGCLLAATGLPATAQEDGGTVTAQVAIAEADEACLLLSVDAVDFGVLDFGEDATSDPAYTVSSCSAGTQELFASSTDAATADASISWAVVDGSGTRGTDQFSVDADLDMVGTSWLANDPTLIGTLGAEAAAQATHTLAMPPPGSAGAGQALSFDITWTAVLAPTGTWTSQDSGTAANLRDVTFVDHELGFAVGDSGTVLRTTDGGANWGPLTTGVGSNVQWHAVDFLDAQRGWLSGGTIAIAATTDGGDTWTGHPIDDSNTQTGIVFATEQLGWTVTQGGRIWHTVDGGANWALQYVDTGMSWWGVHFVDADRGWVVGSLGTVLATDDGGDTWTTQIGFFTDNSVTSQILIGVTFVDENTGWAVGNSGTILATVDGGANWTAQTSGVTGQLTDVAFVDASTGWVVGDSGVILKTVDGGTNWEPQTSGTSEKLDGITVVDATSVWLVGWGGTILTLE